MYLCQNRFGCVPGKIEIEIKGGTLAPPLAYDHKIRGLSSPLYGLSEQY